jgi:hypothetical protein
MRFRSVVLPEPKKPVRMVTGIRLINLPGYLPETSYVRQCSRQIKACRP